MNSFSQIFYPLHLYFSFHLFPNKYVMRTPHIYSNIVVPKQIHKGSVLYEYINHFWLLSGNLEKDTEENLMIILSLTGYNTKFRNV